jgi:hypothetical protein
MVVTAISSGWNGKIYGKMVSEVGKGGPGASSWNPLALTRDGFVERKAGQT